MNLNDGLAVVANYFSLNADELIKFAAEDEIGGYHANPEFRKWPVGSLWEVEGKILYAFIRATKPNSVLEIGVSDGASSTHILTALERNGGGTLTSLDINSGAGRLIPNTLRHRWSFIAGDALETVQFLTQQDVVFEDGPHGFEFTRDVIEACSKLSPSAIFSHDAEHFLVGKDVKAGFEAAVGGPIRTILVEPSDCGLGFWKSKGV